MNEDMLRAASRMQQAADTIQQAARNIDGSVERLARVLEQAGQDGASLMNRLEELNRGS